MQLPSCAICYSNRAQLVQLEAQNTNKDSLIKGLPGVTTHRPRHGLMTEKFNKVQSKSDFGHLSCFSHTRLQTKSPGMTFSIFS